MMPVKLHLFLWIILAMYQIFTVNSEGPDLEQESSFICQTNLCDLDSPGLRCPTNSSIHIHHIYCSHNNNECPWSRYINLYSLCEGSNLCDASGLQLLLKSSCQADDVRKRSVLVEYFCVTDQKIYDSCSTKNFKRVGRGYGIIRSPKTFTVASSESRECKWWIPLVREETNKIVIHMAYTSAKDSSCEDDGFLRIMYMDCKTERAVTKKYCNLESIRDELMTCGPAHVYSSLRKGQSGSFIVSYQGNTGSKREVLPSAYLAKCFPPPEPASHSTAKTARKSEAPGRAASDRQQKFSTSPIFDPKFLILYIALAVLILGLICALVVVIVRYRRLPKAKHRNGDSSERISLWHQNDDTPLDTFGHNGLVEPTGTFTCETTSNGVRPEDRSDEVTATVHEDPYTDYDPDFDPRLSTTSGISTFLSDKRDSGFKDLIKSLQTGSFGTYNTVPDSHMRKSDSSWHDYYELPENGGSPDIYESLERGRRRYPHNASQSPNLSHDNIEFRNHMFGHPEQQPLVSASSHSSDEYHYCVNDDEYALVRKPKKVSLSDNSPQVHYPQEARPDNSSYQGETVDFRPASGPYEKRNGHRNDLTDSAMRWSKGKKWMDEV